MAHWNCFLMFSIALIYRSQQSYLVSCFKTQFLILFIVIIEKIQNNVSVGEKFSNPFWAHLTKLVLKQLFFLRTKSKTKRNILLAIVKEKKYQSIKFLWWTVRSWHHLRSENMRSGHLTRWLSVPLRSETLEELWKKMHLVGPAWEMCFQFRWVGLVCQHVLKAPQEF